MTIFTNIHHQAHLRLQQSASIASPGSSFLDDPISLLPSSLMFDQDEFGAESVTGSHISSVTTPATSAVSNANTITSIATIASTMTLNKFVPSALDGHQENRASSGTTSVPAAPDDASSQLSVMTSLSSVSSKKDNESPTLTPSIKASDEIGVTSAPKEGATGHHIQSLPSPSRGEGGDQGENDEEETSDGKSKGLDMKNEDVSGHQKENDMDLRIVREIQSSKLRVDNRKLTKEYFDRLTCEAKTLCADISPRPDEFRRQDGLFERLRQIVDNIFPANGFCLANADMDLCVSMPDTTKQSPAQSVEKLGHVLKQAGMKDVKMLTRARVPIVKMRDPVSGIRCDIGFQNTLAIYNTRLLKTYSSIDPRFRDLVFIVKYWSKRRNINEPYQRTLSSYCYVLMIIHLLQIRGVLPCLQTLYPPQNASNDNDRSSRLEKSGVEKSGASSPSKGDKGGRRQPLEAVFRGNEENTVTDDESRKEDARKHDETGGVGSTPSTNGTPFIDVDGFNVYFFDDLENLHHYWKPNNNESLGELLVAFFTYYSAQFPFVHGVASIRLGKVLSKEEKGWTKERQQELNRSSSVKDRFWLCVEDPFETTHNIGRPVDKETLYEIRGEFIRASKLLCAGSNTNRGEKVIAKVCERPPAAGKKSAGQNGTKKR
ncbi:hypothetical protein HK102_012931 [Quaeritorhiza haematococci]|nr:hypothetical protein HK102_012931 [Quaeritorhiza haematococci]